jgi:hypothetical protein
LLESGLMHRLKWLALGVAGLAWPSVASAAVYVLGDSIGEGIAAASGLKGLAHQSVRIHSPQALAQIAQVPAGSTVFIVLGTNDAVGSVKKIEKSIQAIVKAGERKQLTMIWLGPPCVRTSWDKNARELDEILRAELAATSVKYVSMRDARTCSSAFHGADGVHATMSGYHYMWDKARAAVGFSGTAVAARQPSKEPVEVVEPNRAPPKIVGAAAVRPPPPKELDDPRIASSVRASAPVAPLPAEPARAASDSGRRMILEVHVPPAAPSAPLVWLKSAD